MTSWHEVRLGDVCKFQNGKKRPKELGKYPVFGGNGILDYTNQFNSNVGVIVGRVGAYCGSVFLSKEKCWVSDNAILGMNTSDTDIIYLYYLLKGLNLNAKHIGSGQPLITQDILNNIKISLPPLDVQKKIAGVLGALDDKIELNNKINASLEQQMYTLVEQNILNIETKISLDELCNVFTGRKNANEFEKNGVNKFFTCGPEALTINSFIYNGPAIIVSGNGAYTGRTRFYNGKFDLYQRTYACTIKENIKSDYIYILYPILKLQLEKKLMGGTHGSAIPYIVMNDIAKFQVPFNEAIFNKIAPMCKAMIDKIQANEAENEKLSALRDTLMPRLMNGEIDVSKVDIWNSNLLFRENA